MKLTKRGRILAVVSLLVLVVLVIVVASSGGQPTPASPPHKAGPVETERQKVLKKPMSKEAREAVEAEPAETKKAQEAGWTAYTECKMAEGSDCTGKGAEAEAASHSEGK